MRTKRPEGEMEYVYFFPPFKNCVVFVSFIFVRIERKREIFEKTLGFDSVAKSCFDCLQKGFFSFFTANVED